MGLEKLANPDRRVVITGLGVCTPLGRGVEDFWKNRVAGKSSIRDVTNSHPYLRQYKIKVGALFENYELDQSKIDYQFRGMGVEETGGDRMSMNTQMALEAASEAIKDSGFLDRDSVRYRTGTAIGAGFGGMLDIEKAVRGMVVEGLRKQLPNYLNDRLRGYELKGTKDDGEFIAQGLMDILDDDERMNELIGIGMGKRAAVDPKIGKRAIPGDAAATVARFYGLHKGNARSSATACSSAHTNVIDGVYYIAANLADVMVVGGSQEISPLIISGFGNVRALTTNPDPLTASRPFDKDRDGFVVGEGSAILVLEEYEHARKRGANIYAEILGFGEQLDSKYSTLPREDVFFSSLALRETLDMADLNTRDVDCFYAHGTSTGPNDKYESLAIKDVFGDDTKIPVIGSRGSTGHGLNYGTAIIESALSIRDNVAPPTVGLVNPDIDGGCTLNYNPGDAEEMMVDTVISNASAFGGRDSSVAVARV